MLEQLFTVEEVAKAWCVSEWQLTEWCRLGKVDGARKLGKFWRFTASAHYVYSAPTAEEPPKRAHRARPDWLPDGDDEFLSDALR